MKKKFICLVLLAALCLSVCSALSACTVKTVVSNPYESVYIINPYLRMTAYEEPKSLGLDTLEITLAKNEREGAQLTVYSKTTEYMNMVVSASDLTNEKGSVLTKENIDLFREEYSYYNGQTGQTLENREGSAQILVPLNDGEFNSANTTKGKNLLYYIRINTPESTEAGVYNGTITLSHSEGEITVPLCVTVLDFALETRPVLSSDLLYWQDFTTRYYAKYGSALTTEENEELYNQMLYICNSNKLTVVNEKNAPAIDNTKTAEEYIEKMKQYLRDNPNITCIDAPVSRAYVDGLLKIDNERTLPYLNALKDAGLIGMARAWLVDEPHNDTDYENLNYVGRWTDEYFPELINYTPILPHAIDWNKVDANAIDIYCYAYGGCSVQELKAAQRGERTLWSYAFPKNPDLSFSQIRLMGWENKKFLMEGIEDWCLNNFVSEFVNGQWVVDKCAALYYAYVYPSMQGDGIANRTMFLPTFTIETFRDAVEDYEYLIKLQELVQNKIDTLGLDITIHEAMESYYDGVFLDVHRLPENEEDGFMAVRNRVIDELQNGVPYIITTAVDNKMWETDNRYITIYAAAGENIIFDGEKLETTTEGKYSVAKTYKTIGSESKTYEIECGGKTTKQHILSKDFDKKQVVDLSSSTVYDALKEANPNTNFEIYDEDGKSVLKVTFDTSTKRGFVIPAEYMKTQVGSYYTVRCNAWADSDDNTFVPVFQLLSGTSNISTDYETEYFPSTDKHVPFTGSFDPAEAQEVGKKLASFRIRLNKSSTEPVTLYFSDIFFINESNNFQWEIVE